MGHRNASSSSHSLTWLPASCHWYRELLLHIIIFFYLIWEYSVLLPLRRIEVTIQRHRPTCWELILDFVIAIWQQRYGVTEVPPTKRNSKAAGRITLLEFFIQIGWLINSLFNRKFSRLVILHCAHKVLQIRNWMHFHGAKNYILDFRYLKGNGFIVWIIIPLITQFAASHICCVFRYQTVRRWVLSQLRHCHQ